MFTVFPGLSWPLARVRTPAPSAYITSRNFNAKVANKWKMKLAMELPGWITTSLKGLPDGGDTIGGDQLLG